MIEQRGDKWVLLSSDGKEILGEHDTEEEAKEQERAILAEKSKRSKRVDAVRLGKARKTSNGFLEAPAYLTRCGVFEYRNPNGSICRELRPPEEVFKQKSLESLRHAPLITMDNHRIDGDYWITSENARHTMIGFVSGTPHPANEYVGGLVVITDKRHIDASENKDLGDLSCGYTYKNDYTPGVWRDGKSYDLIQRDIVYNHVALVPRGIGRAGEQVALHLDSTEPTFEGIEQMPDTNDKDKGQATDKMAEALLDKDRQIAELKRHVDAKDGEITALKAELDKAKDPTEFQRRVDARIELLDAARDVLGKDADLKGNDRDVKSKIISKIHPNIHLDSKLSDDYIDGVYRTAIENHRVDAMRDTRTHLDSIGTPPVDPITLLYTNMVETNRQNKF